MGEIIGSDSLPTYRGLEIDSTLFLLSECDIWWFLVEPDIRTRVKKKRNKFSEKDNTIVDLSYCVATNTITKHVTFNDCTMYDLF